MTGQVEVIGAKSESLIGVNQARETTHIVNSTYNLKFDGKVYPLTYQITGAGNKINSITAEVDNTTLLLNILAQSNGKLTIELPRDLIDSKILENNIDERYRVILGLHNITQTTFAFSEINTKNNAQARTLAIDFDKGTEKIEIAGNYSLLRLYLNKYYKGTT